MFNVRKKTSHKRGFTIVELLVVIAIMAVVATLATQAAMKAMRQSRSKRIETTRRSLELALMNYRTLHGEWSFDTSIMQQDPKLGAQFLWLHGKNNAKAFESLLATSNGKKSYLDTSALFTRVNGARMTVQKAIQDNRSDIAIGYAQPDNVDRFYYYCVLYRKETDSVVVFRSDENHSADGQDDHYFPCPENKN